jgi:hypothetical protein
MECAEMSETTKRNLNKYQAIGTRREIAEAIKAERRANFWRQVMRFASLAVLILLALGMMAYLIAVI